MGIGGRASRPGLAGEAVRVQKGQEKAEVLLLAPVGRGGEEEEVLAPLGKALAQAVALGGLHLLAVVGGGHLVGLVHHHQVPVHLQGLLRHLGEAGQAVQAGDPEGVLPEGVSQGHLQKGAGEDLEVQAKLLPKLLLPLQDEPPGGHHQAPLQGAPEEEFPDVEPGHDGLAGPGVVGQEETQGGAGEEVAVDGLNLVGKGLHHRGVHGHVGVKEVGQADALGLRGQAEEVPGGVQGKAGGGFHLQPGQVLGIEEGFPQPPLWVSEGDLGCLGEEADAF